MSQLKRTILLLSLMLVVGVFPAAAQITGTPLSLPERPSGRNSVAFDSVNQVYLVALAGSGRVVAKFLNKTGAQIGNAFLIANEAPYIGWVGVTFGGTPADPAFLVTYVATTGANCVANKYGRLVRYSAGQAIIGGPSWITGVGCEWPSAEKAQSAWTGAQFVVGTRVGTPLPQPEIRTFDLGGNVSAPVILGDYLDYYGSPVIACASDGVCLVSGYANGIPFGAKGGTYARLVYGPTLQPLTAMFYLDDHSSRMEDQNVVFSAKTGQFLAAWARAGYVDTRIVSHEGAPQALNLGMFGGGVAGDLALSSNNGTGTVTLSSKYSVANTYGLYVVELDPATALAPNPNNLMLVSVWDGVWPEFTPAIAANSADGQWLVVAVETSGGRAALIQGGSMSTVTARKADFSSDAKADIIWQHDNGNLSVWTMNGTTATGGLPLTPGFIDPNWRIVATADLNGDSKPDLVWQHTNGSLAVWYMNGTTLIASEFLNPGQLYGNWRVVGAGDFNGDGKMDLVWQHTEGWLAVWYMNGATVLASQVLNPGLIAGNDWKIAGVGDFNSDGKPDLVWQHTDGWLAVWYMNGPNMIGSAYLNPSQVADPDWRIRAVIDLNGDGQTDLIWQHMSAGWLAAWLMNGSVATNSVYLNPSSVAAGWKIMGPR